MQIALALLTPLALLGVTLVMERIEGHAMASRTSRKRGAKS